LKRVEIGGRWRVNIQCRLTDNPVETARAFQTLMNQFGLSQQELSKRVGKSQSVISRLIHLLQLPDEILDSLARGEIQEGHAQALLQIKEEIVLAYVWRQLTTERLSVKETQQRIRSVHNVNPELLQNALETPLPPHEATATPEPWSNSWERPDENSLIEQLTKQYATRFAVQRYGHQGGYIEIRFIDDLHLFDLLRELQKSTA
jgi:ParB-like chromosome segregation protein Spo0J